MLTFLIIGFIVSIVLFLITMSLEHDTAAIIFIFLFFFSFALLIATRSINDRGMLKLSNKIERCPEIKSNIKEALEDDVIKNYEYYKIDAIYNECMSEKLKSNLKTGLK